MERALAALITGLVLPLVAVGLLACVSLVGGIIGAPLLLLVGPLFLYGVQIAGGSYPLFPWYARWAMGVAGIAAVVTLAFAVSLRHSVFPTAVLLVPLGWSAVLLAAGWALDRASGVTHS